MLFSRFREKVEMNRDHTSEDRVVVQFSSQSPDLFLRHTRSWGILIQGLKKKVGNRRRNNLLKITIFFISTSFNSPEQDI